MWESEGTDRAILERMHMAEQCSQCVKREGKLRKLVKRWRVNRAAILAARKHVLPESEFALELQGDTLEKCINDIKQLL